MSILLPNDKLWGVANWISRGFFSDAEQFLQHTSFLAEEIGFCIKTGLDTIDLRNSDLATIRELSALVNDVIARNRVTRGGDFHDPEMFPVYLERLELLNTMTKEALEWLEERKP